MHRRYEDSSVEVPCVGSGAPPDGYGALGSGGAQLPTPQRGRDDHASRRLCGPCGLDTADLELHDQGLSMTEVHAGIDQSGDAAADLGARCTTTGRGRP